MPPELLRLHLSRVTTTLSPEYRQLYFLEFGQLSQQSRSYPA